MLLARSPATRLPTARTAVLTRGPMKAGAKHGVSRLSRAHHTRHAGHGTRRESAVQELVSAHQTAHRLSERIILPWQWARCGTGTDPQRVPGSRDQASLQTRPSSHVHAAPTRNKRPIHPSASQRRRTRLIRRSRPTHLHSACDIHRGWNGHILATAERTSRRCSSRHRSSQRGT